MAIAGASSSSQPSVGQWSEEARHFLRCALTPSTRSNYEAAYAKYRAWCFSQGLDGSLAAITSKTAADWLAHTASSTTLSSRTIMGHRSALATLRGELLIGDASPLHVDGMDRMLKGMQRAKAPAESAKRNAAPRTVVITFELLAELEAYTGIRKGGTPQEIMRWAAACTGAFGLLRPSEFLGVAKNRSTALQLTGITFYAQKDSQRRAGMLPPGSDPASFAVPDRAALALGPTKADQLATNAPVLISSPLAVKALWTWLHLRRDLGGSDTCPVFRVPLPGEHQLSVKELCEHLSQWIGLAHNTAPPHVTGRCFRRGGASSLVAAGATRSETMQAGRWLSQAMPDVYASAEAKQARSLELGRQQHSRISPAACTISAAASHH